MKRSLLSKLIRLVAIAGLFLAIVFPFTAVVHQLISEVDSQIQFARQERRGLEYNARLRTVLEYIIEHQSQVQRYLEGDSAYKPRVLAIESQIDREIEAIDALDRRLISENARVIRDRGGNIAYFDKNKRGIPTLAQPSEERLNQQPKV